MENKIQGILAQAIAIFLVAWFSQMVLEPLVSLGYWNCFFLVFVFMMAVRVALPETRD